MEIPRGELVRSRAAADPGEVLRTVLDRELTGYLVLEPAGTLLFDDDARGVLTFAEGVPVLAYCEADDRDYGGGGALAALSTPGPCHADVFALPPSALAEAHAVDALRVGPGAPARELADDRALAERTRAAAPAERAETGDHDAVAAFLADEARVDAVREAAREEARARAAEWGLDDHLADAESRERRAEE